MDATERAPLMCPGPSSDGQFYSPPESVAGRLTRTDIHPKTCHTYLKRFLLIHKLSVTTESLAVRTVHFKETRRVQTLTIWSVGQRVESFLNLPFYLHTDLFLSCSDSDEDLDDKHDPEKGLIQQVT